MTDVKVDPYTRNPWTEMTYPEHCSRAESWGYLEVRYQVQFAVVAARYDLFRALR